MFCPQKKVGSFLPPVKGSLGLRTPGKYNIQVDQWECGSQYIGQTIRTIEEIKVGHQRWIRHKHTSKSAGAKHSIMTIMKLNLQDKLLERANNYCYSIILEAFEIQIRHLSQVWNSEIHGLNGPSNDNNCPTTTCKAIWNSTHFMRIPLWFLVPSIAIERWKKNNSQDWATVINSNSNNTKY